MITFFNVIEAFLLGLAISLDTLFACFGYGINKIKIPLCSMLSISGINTLCLLISLLIGRFIKNYINTFTINIICFSILLLIGLIKLFDYSIKKFIRKITQKTNKISFSFHDFKFMLSVYSDPIIADFDNSKTLSIKESIAIGFMLSIDGLAIGFSSGLCITYPIILLLLTFLFSLLFAFTGSKLGNKISKSTNFDLSFISGVILILIGVSKLL